MGSFRVLLGLAPFVLACQEDPYTGLAPAQLKCQGGTPVNHVASLCADGDLVFAAAEDGLHVLDARLDPKQMEVSMVGADAGLVLPLKGVACRAGRVYVTDADGFSVFDASNPAALSKTGAVVSTNKGFTAALALGEDRAYAASEAGFVEVYDITDDNAPALAKAVYYPEPVLTLSYGGKWLAVAFSLGMEAVKVVSTASDDLEPLGEVGVGFPRSILARGDHLYVAGGQDRFMNYDLSKLSAPQLIPVRNFELPPGGTATTFAVADDYLFVGGGIDSMLAYDIYDPEQVVLDSSIRLGGDCPNFAPSTLASSGRTIFAVSSGEVDVIR